MSRRSDGIGFSPTLAVSELARKLRAEGRDILDFSAGQPDFPTPESVCDAAVRAIEAGHTRYTPAAGIPELRRAIGEPSGYPPDQVVVSSGAKASLYFALQALVDEGDEVLIPSPYWTSYPEQVRLAGATPVFVTPEDPSSLIVEAADVERVAGPAARVLMLNYPSNPTGETLSREQLEALARLCVDRGIWILADEIYARILYDGRQHVSVVDLGPDVRARTVLIDGASKTYSMTGWRIGWAAAPIEVASAMSKIQSHATSNATSISQWATLAALELPQAELDRRVVEFARRRELMVQRLHELPGIECSLPAGAFYVFPDVSGCFGGRVTCGEELATWLLEKAGVAVVPGEAFGSSRHVRLSYAISYDDVREGMDRIAAALSELRASG